MKKIQIETDLKNEEKLFESNLKIVEDLERLFPSEIIKVEGEFIFVNEVGFKIESGKLTKVIMMNEL